MSYYFFDPFEDLMDDWFFGFPRVSRRRTSVRNQASEIQARKNGAKQYEQT
jgi:hypothetical protein